MYEVRLGDELKLRDGAWTVTQRDAFGCFKLRNTVTTEYKDLHITAFPDELVEQPPMFRSDIRDADDANSAAKIAAETLRTHITELLTGEPLPGGSKREEYDPTGASFGARLKTKSAEIGIGQSTLRKKINDFEREGVAGLIDRRALRQEEPFARFDHRIREAFFAVIAAETNKSTGRLARLEHRMEKELQSAHPGVTFTLPSRTTFTRWTEEHTDARRTRGAATLRRTSSIRPTDGVQNSRRAYFPGAEVQMDSTTFDVFVRDENGRAFRPHLTIMVDKATRSIIGFNFATEAPNGLDHAVTLARCLTPRPLRPGTYDFLKGQQGAMPWAALFDEDEVTRFDLRRPFTVPERILIDNGADYRSDTFLSACARYGISLTEAAIRTGWHKGLVEREMLTVKDLFASHLPGYSGGNTEDRGLAPEKEQLLDFYELTELFDRWVSVVWQNRAHQALRDPIHPKLIHTPNTMYAALWDVSGASRMPISADEYIALMPHAWRTISHSGIQIGYRIYDSAALIPFHSVRSPHNSEHDGKWAVKYDPSDPSTAWIRDPATKEWVAAFWKNLDDLSRPFAREIRSKALKLATNIGRADDKTTIRFIELMLENSDTERERAARRELRSETSRAGVEDAGLIVAASIEAEPDAEARVEEETYVFEDLGIIGADDGASDD
jgi:putative transposase